MCLLEPVSLSCYATRLFLPPTECEDSQTVVTADTSAENLCWLRAAYPDARIVGAGKSVILARLEQRLAMRSLSPLSKGSQGSIRSFPPDRL